MSDWDSGGRSPHFTSLTPGRRDFWLKLLSGHQWGRGGGVGDKDRVGLFTMNIITERLRDSAPPVFSV